MNFAMGLNFGNHAARGHDIVDGDLQRRCDVSIQADTFFKSWKHLIKLIDDFPDVFRIDFNGWNSVGQFTELRRNKDGCHKNGFAIPWSQSALGSDCMAFQSFGGDMGSSVIRVLVAL